MCSVDKELPYKKEGVKIIKPKKINRLNYFDEKF